MDDRTGLVINALGHSYRRDLRKGEDDLAGLRSTVDIAESSGMSTAAARRALDRLSEKGDVDFCGTIEGLGNVQFWRLGDGPRAEIDAELSAAPSL